MFHTDQSPAHILHHMIVGKDHSISLDVNLHVNIYGKSKDDSDLCLPWTEPLSPN